MRAGTLKRALSAANCEVGSGLPKITDPPPPRQSGWLLSVLVLVETAALAYLKLRRCCNRVRSKVKA